MYPVKENGGTRRQEDMGSGTANGNVREENYEVENIVWL